MSKTIEFNPNKLDTETAAWAVYIPTRNPKFKAYTHKRYAASALSYHGYGILYRLVGEEWVEEWRRDEPKKCCDKCGEGDSRYGFHGYTISEPRYMSDKYCYPCHKQWRLEQAYAQI